MTSLRSGFSALEGRQAFVFSRRSIAALGPIQRIKVVKRPGPEADHSLPSTAKVKNK